nr:hypothetical protein [Tanacetum cinerariifolium]
MSSPSAPTVPETITPTNRANDSLVITHLHDDPYMLIRQAYTPIVTDTDSEPLKDPIETKETQPLSPMATPLVLDYTLSSPDYTSNKPHSDEDSEPIVASETRTASPSAKVIEAMVLSPSLFRKRYRSSYETHSSSASPALSPTLPIRKRYRGTSESILDTKTEEDESEAEGTDLEIEESEDEGLGYEAARHHALELADDPIPSTFEVGQISSFVLHQQVADEMPRLPTRPTWVDLEFRTVYIDIEFDAPPVCTPVQSPASPEWSPGSLPVSPASLTVTSPVDSPVITPAATISVEEDEFIEVGAQLELHRGILHDHTQRLDALPPTLIRGMGRDIIELYDRSAAIREEIYS